MRWGFMRSLSAPGNWTCRPALEGRKPIDSIRSDWLRLQCVAVRAADCRPARVAALPRSPLPFPSETHPSPGVVRERERGGSVRVALGININFGPAIYF